MEKYVYRKATERDIEFISEIRLEVLKSANDIEHLEKTTLRDSEMNNIEQKIEPIGFWTSFLLFFVLGVIFAFDTKYLIPFIVKQINVNPFIISQIVLSFSLFIPIFVTTIILLKHDKLIINWQNIKKRLNIKRLRVKDLFWIFGSLFVAIIITGLIIIVLYLLPSFNLDSIKNISPIALKPLKGYELFFLLFMPIFWFFNYVGEEILWRGYLYPRQEIIFRKKTWIINGLLHGVFHFYMELPVLIFLPILLSIPFVYNKTRNTSAVIIMHALLGVPMDFLLAIGVLK